MKRIGYTPMGLDFQEVPAEMLHPAVGNVLAIDSVSW
jgi:hypothetical protein